MRYLVALSFFLLLACTTSPPKAPEHFALEKISFHNIAGWELDTQNEALGAFLKSCGAIAKQEDSETVGQGQLQSSVTIWKPLCRRAALLSTGDAPFARAFFEESFIPFRVTKGNDPAGLFTGYFEPLLMGSLTYKPPYIYPVYALPKEGTPVYTRSQIDQGALNNQAPVIAYVDDPVQLFFLHVQGSGRIQLDDGRFLHLGYAGSNGLKYVALGKILINKGALKKEEVSMPAVRQWLYDHPEDKWQLMWENPSYIYFHELEGDAVGAGHAALTPGRSLAVDARYIPLGMPVFVDTVLPSTPSGPITLYRRLMIAQDTGSAIQGPIRGDIFFGFGPAAEQFAGHMKSGGEYFVLVPRALAATLQ